MSTSEIGVLRLSDQVLVEKVKDNRWRLQHIGKDSVLYLGASAQIVLDMLHAGTTFERMVQVIIDAYPSQPASEQALRGVVRSLAEAGMLDSTVGMPSVRPRQIVWDISTKVNAIGLSLLSRPRMHKWAPIAYVLPVLGLAAGVSTLAIHPFGAWSGLGFNWWALAIIFAVWLPLHELLHVLACFHRGIPARHVGVIYFLAPIPWFSLFTGADFRRHGQEKERISTYAAGPAADLTLWGATSLLVWVYPESALWKSLFVMGGLVTYTSLFPWGASDSARMLDIIGRLPSWRGPSRNKLALLLCFGLIPLCAGWFIAVIALYF